MKKICIFSAIILLAFCLCGCRRVVVTTADELEMSNWSAQTRSGMTAELLFCEDTASFKVYDSKEKLLSEIQGVFAIDGKNLYITDSGLCKTYIFGYKVYGDRAELEYSGEVLTFYLASEPSADVSAN